MTVILKLGGSLLTLPGLAENLRVVLQQRSADFCLVIPGGGESADLVRTWSRIHHLGDEAAHWLAISSMDLNRRLIEVLLDWKSVSSRAHAEGIWAGERSPLLLEMNRFAATEEMCSNEQLPHNWQVTSDSLAAWTAVRWHADELILLKSIPVPKNLTVDEASRQGIVDAYFPNFSDKLPKISWCNLRASTLIEPWL